MEAPLAETRFLLRGWTSQDAVAVDDIVNVSRADFRKWLPTLEVDLADFDVFLDRVRRCASTGTGWYYCVEVGGAVVGQCSIESRPERAAEVGYWIRSDRTNEGLATLAVLALRRLAAGHGFERLVIRCDEGNARSASVARAAGFTHVRTVGIDGALSGTEAQTGREMTWQLELNM